MRSIFHRLLLAVFGSLFVADVFLGPIVEAAARFGLSLAGQIHVSDVALRGDDAYYFHGRAIRDRLVVSVILVQDPNMAEQTLVDPDDAAAGLEDCLCVRDGIDEDSVAARVLQVEARGPDAGGDDHDFGFVVRILKRSDGDETSTSWLQNPAENPSSMTPGQKGLVRNDVYRLDCVYKHVETGGTKLA